uniref:Ig-like domain-containing protein n=1 Tax=Spermophilus dauricus TaxID=99837 RepID=A0A8C9UXA0_SPEDA
QQHGLPSYLVVCVLCFLVCLSSFLPPMSVFTEQFQVVGPRHPIVAVLGEDAILPCALFPAMNAENMELGWFRTTLSQAVFIYWNQREQTEEQMDEYRGRTSLVKDFLSEGQASVHIHKVQVSDNGMYTCFFRHGGFYEEADLEVKVAGMGSAPQVHIEGPEEDGVCVVCKASGWFPKPQVQWRDLSGNKFPALSEAHTQDTEELFSVEATLVVRDSSVGNVTCSVLNPVLDQEKAVAIYIPGQCCSPSQQSCGEGLASLSVISPYCPIVAVLGKDAILSCALVPGINAENMELGWFRTTLSQAVFIYWNQWEQTEEQMADYRGWTSLVSKFLTQGQAAVHIHKVQVSDNGTYACFFRHGGFSEKADLELKVAGMGADPQVHKEGPEEDGVPQVHWRDLNGNKFPALSEAHTQDTEELFSVEATLVVRDSSVGDVTCSVLNPVLDQEKAMAIYIPGQCCSHSQQSCGERLASLSVLALLGVPLTCCLPGPQSPSSLRLLPGSQHLLWS